MREIVITLADVVNEIHDILTFLFSDMTDKELHFWVMGIIGMVTFLVVHFFFKLIERLKWSTTILSFIYTFTGMVVLVFAIELQQAITNRGNMEFADAVIGLWGFIVLFFIYAVLGLIVYVINSTFAAQTRQVYLDIVR
ncbi:hypothetical protein DEJ66_17710 [Bacilli bacterium]|nr:hypothetical protein DEJ66_17710 [Bacilli bacterium]